MIRFVTVLALVGFAGSAAAFERVLDRSDFVSLVDGNELRLALLGIRLEVNADGSIAGQAQGWDVTGSWDWQNGYFCRQMDWSGTPIPYNCQLVEQREGEKVRFTVDQGDGRAATFTIR